MDGVCPHDEEDHPCVYRPRADGHRRHDRRSCFFVAASFAAAVLCCFVVLLFLILVIQKSDIWALFSTVVGAVYFGVGFGSFLYLRGGDDLLAAGAASIHGGIFLLWFALIGTWSSDTFAYAVGKNLGRHKMAPHISPNKTMEGLAGGAVGCVALCLAYAAYFDFALLPAFSWEFWWPLQRRWGPV